MKLNLRLTMKCRRAFIYLVTCTCVVLMLLLLRSRLDAGPLPDVGVNARTELSPQGGVLAVTTSADKDVRVDNHGQIITEPEAVHNTTTRRSSAPVQSPLVTELTTHKQVEIVTVSMETNVEQELDSSLRQNMKRCSRALGVSEEALINDEKTLSKVGTKANLLLRAFQQIVPKSFSTNYKSPCWRDPQNSKLYCLPFFMVAGFPKSGTSSLHHGMIQHPEICTTGEKEPHWWTRHNPGDTGHIPKDYHPAIMRYLRILRAQISTGVRNPKAVTWDNSQSTLWDSPFFMDTQDYCALPAVISRLLPDLKFIVQMRDPVTRIYSHYLYSCSSTLGSDPSKWPVDIRLRTADTFHNLAVSGVNEFNECLHTSSLYECTNVMTSKFKAIHWKDTCAFITHQMFVGLYYVHIAKWLQFYPRENFLFLRIDDMSDPYELMSKITNFLGLSPATRQQAEKWFASKANTQKAFSTSSRKHEMRKDTRELLEELYRPYNEMLAGLVGDQKFLFQDED